ncbi:predicted protein [Naegleria gruberi]|uniref:Predicted protein n=1 Tax=Naegleria gruberi TaxID=5762 RepID=D2VMX6_NAEGR|nr:uncharacterized protein NAEGRDRAFT_70295 [Naegleria gruberi]EFC41900.1 predicted protein [Naegleria gruberi]|eukprot:XP_002674644.1 predicted protein [Naegleria gruberi strain NEG-M]
MHQLSEQNHQCHQPSERKPISEETYTKLLKEIESVMSDESNLIANLANCASLFYNTFLENGHPINWFGFYLIDVKTNDKPIRELVLGPFHGKLACTRIRFGKGVCGACITKEEIIVVPNVHEFSGHIACDSASNSEICVPLFNSQNGQVFGLIDVDSTALEQFSLEIDGKYLKELANLITKYSDLI